MVLTRSLSSLPCRVDDAESIMNLASTCKDMFALCKEPGVARKIWKHADDYCFNYINDVASMNAIFAEAYSYHRVVSRKTWI